MAQLAADHDIEPVWLPFELRPEPEPLPDTSPEALEQGKARWAQGVGPLAERFGVEMRPASHKPRSRMAHEAAEFARDHGQFDPMRTALFQAQWCADRNLGDAAVLSDLARGIGLDGEALRAALADGQYTARVRQLELISAQLGVRAVPTMIFGDAIAVQGAQPYPVLREAFEMAAREASDDPPAK